MAAPTIVLSATTSATTPLSPAVVNSHLEIFHRALDITQDGWTQNGATDEYYLDTSGYGTVYNIRVFEKKTINIRTTGYQWTASAGGTSEYYLEASGGGDPGLYPFLEVGYTETKAFCFRASINGSAVTSGLPGELAAGRAAWGSNPADSLGFQTVYVRLSDGADPDSKADGFVTVTIHQDLTLGSGAGSLNAGEYYYDSAADRLYIRTSGGVDPDGLTAGDIVWSYDLCTTGTAAGNDWHLCTCQCAWLKVGATSASDYSAAQRYTLVTDPVRDALSHTADVDLTSWDNEGYSSSVILTAGEWVPVWRVINADGEVTVTAGDSVTIAANTRTKKTIAASGGDYTSLATAISTDGGTANIWYELEDGHAETISAEMAGITGAQALITVAGNGTATLTLTNGEFIRSSASGLIVDGLTFTPAAVHTTKEVFNLQGTHQGVSKCHFNGTAAGNRFSQIFFYDNDPRYLSILNNTGGDYRDYIYVGQANDYCARDVQISGNDFDASTNESGVRTVGGTDRLTLSYNKLDCTNGSDKSTYRAIQSNGHYAHHNHFLNGNLWIGIVVGGFDGVDGVRLSGNLAEFYTTLQTWQVKESSTRVACVNNVIRNTGNARPVAFDSSPDMPLDDIWFLHNTIDAQDTQCAVQAETGVTASHVNLGDRHWKGNANIYNAGALNYSATNIQARFGNNSVDGWAFTANQWIDPTDLSDTEIVNILGGTDADLAAWNALANVGTDYTATATIGADYLPSATQAVTLQTGTYFDIWGNRRSATTVAGAAAAADAGVRGQFVDVTPTAAGAIGSTSVVIDFGETLSAESLSTASFSFRKDGNPAPFNVPGSVSASQTVTLTTSTALVAGSAYEVDVNLSGELVFDTGLQVYQETGIEVTLTGGAVSGQRSRDRSRSR